MNILVIGSFADLCIYVFKSLQFGSHYQSFQKQSFEN